MAENMDATGSGEQQEKRGMSRRTVLAGAAWSVPVIAVATAAPAMAAFSPPVFISAFGQGCKYPGRSVTGRPYGYVFGIELTNSEDVDVTVVFTAIILNGESLTIEVVEDEFGEPIPGAVLSGVELGPEETEQFAVIAGGATNSANGVLRVEYEWYVDGVLAGSSFAETTLPLNPVNGGCVVWPTWVA